MSPDTGGPRPKKLFIIARRDLSCGQRAVQACHALAELLRNCGDDPQLREWLDKHKTLIILGVRDMGELLCWEQRLSELGITHAVFTEPDRGDEKTAIAVHPMAHRRLFRKLQLM